MEIINKRSEGITSNQRVNLAAYFKIADRKYIYLSAGLCLQFSLSPGLFIHFCNDEDRWYFFANTENDGFRLVSRPGKNSLLICDSSLVQLIKKRMFISEGTKFPVALTTAKMKGHHLVEIFFNKPFN